MVKIWSVIRVWCAGQGNENLPKGDDIFPVILPYLNTKYLGTRQVICNIRFDGDSITVRIILVKKVADAFKRLRLRTAALDLTKEGEFSHIVAIPQPTAQAWANYLRGIDK